jgi:hypothetical protein
MRPTDIDNISDERTIRNKVGRISIRFSALFFVIKLFFHPVRFVEVQIFGESLLDGVIRVCDDVIF